MVSGLSRRTRIVLVVSLALNVFALGALASAWVLGGPGFGASHRPARFIGLPLPRQLQAALPERDHGLLRTTLDAHRPEIRTRIRAIFAARRAVADAIRAEPFDRARLEAALAALREKEGATAEEAHRMMTDLAAKLDAGGRAKVAELITVRPRRARR
jgi:uncharacterized membrane protein